MAQRLRSFLPMKGDTRDAILIPDEDDFLEEEMITPSIILAKMISEKPNRLQSIGSQVVEHD